MMSASEEVCDIPELIPVYSDIIFGKIPYQHYCCKLSEIDSQLNHIYGVRELTFTIALDYTTNRYKYIIV